MLCDLQIKNAKPKEKAYKMADKKGLFLLVGSNGSKYWRLKYRFTGKEKTLAIGVYPDVSLKKARQKRDEARSQLADNIDPSAVKQAKKRAQRTQAAKKKPIISNDKKSIDYEGLADLIADKIIEKLGLSGEGLKLTSMMIKEDLF